MPPFYIMADFNIVAQLQLREPSSANMEQVVRRIISKVQSISVPIDVKVSPNAASQLTKIAKSGQQLNSTLSSTNKTMRETSTVSRTMGTELGRAANLMEEFGKSSALALKRNAAFLLSSGSLITFLFLLKKGVGDAIEFERQMIKVAQVTGKSVGDLSSLNNEISRLSINLGVSSVELVGVARTLAQTGISAREVEKALAAIAKSDLAPTFENMADTTEGVISIMRQFDVPASQMEGKLASLDALASKFAVESGDLIEVIRRAGGVFKATGGSLEGLLAVFTAVRSTTRESASSIATGLRTIFTRIPRARTIEQLDRLGISLTDAEGKFIGAIPAIEKIGNAIKQLQAQGGAGADIRFFKIAELLGGFRQIGKVLPLLTRTVRIQEALKVATQENLSLDKNVSIAKKGLGRQIASLKEEFNSLVRSITTGSDSFRVFLTTTLSLGSGILKLVKAISPFLPILGLIGGLAGAKGAISFGRGFAGQISGRVSPEQKKGIVAQTANTGAITANTQAIQRMSGQFSLRRVAGDRPVVAIPAFAKTLPRGSGLNILEENKIPKRTFGDRARGIGSAGKSISGASQAVKGFVNSIGGVELALSGVAIASTVLVGILGKENEVAQSLNNQLVKTIGLFIGVNFALKGLVPLIGLFSTSLASKFSSLLGPIGALAFFASAAAVRINALGNASREAASAGDVAVAFAKKRESVQAFSPIGAAQKALEVGLDKFSKGQTLTATQNVIKLFGSIGAGIFAGGKEFVDRAGGKLKEEEKIDINVLDKLGQFNRSIDIIQKNIDDVLTGRPLQREAAGKSLTAELAAQLSRAKTIKEAKGVESIEFKAIQEQVRSQLPDFDKLLERVAKTSGDRREFFANKDLRSIGGLRVTALGEKSDDVNKDFDELRSQTNLTTRDLTAALRGLAADARFASDSLGTLKGVNEELQRSSGRLSTLFSGVSSGLGTSRFEAFSSGIFERAISGGLVNQEKLRGKAENIAGVVGLGQDIVEKLLGGSEAARILPQILLKTLSDPLAKTNPGQAFEKAFDKAGANIPEEIRKVIINKFEALTLGDPSKLTDKLVANLAKSQELIPEQIREIGKILAGTGKELDSLADIFIQSFRKVSEIDLDITKRKIDVSRSVFQQGVKFTERNRRNLPPAFRSSIVGAGVQEREEQRLTLDQTGLGAFATPKDIGDALRQALKDRQTNIDSRGDISSVEALRENREEFTKLNLAAAKFRQALDQGAIASLKLAEINKGLAEEEKNRKFRGDILEGLVLGTIEERVRKNRATQVAGQVQQGNVGLDRLPPQLQGDVVAILKKSGSKIGGEEGLDILHRELKRITGVDIAAPTARAVGLEGDLKVQQDLQRDFKAEIRESLLLIQKTTSLAIEEDFKKGAQTIADGVLKALEERGETRENGNQLTVTDFEKFSESTNALNIAADKLLKIPTDFQITSTSQITINHNGAEVLSQLNPAIQTIVINNINNSLKKFAEGLQRGEKPLEALG